MFIHSIHRRNAAILGLATLLSACGGGGTTATNAGSTDLTVTATGAGSDLGENSTHNALAAIQSTETNDMPRRIASAVVALTYASPKVAVVDYSKIETAARRTRLAKYNLAIIGIDTQQTPLYLSQVAAAIKSANPATKIAQYTSVGQVRDDLAAQAATLTSSDWWLRNTAGDRVQLAPEWNAYETNMTDWAPADANGQRWPQWKATYDATTTFQQVPQIDYVFTDSVMYQNVTADWQRISADQTVADTAVQDATRRGFASYWDTLRSLSPGLKMMGNAHTDLLASPEIKGKLEGAFLEAMMGKSWSYGTWAGWSKMMDIYRTAIRNTIAPKLVVFHMYVPSATDYALVRYGIASALLEDGHFAVNTDNLSEELPWYDEFSAPLGTPVDPPPTGPIASGIYWRRYTNGLVLVNPTAVKGTINIGTGHRRIVGTLDPAVNTGLPQSMITLGPKQGLVMLKVRSALNPI